jgi:hypothetical protein
LFTRFIGSLSVVALLTASCATRHAPPDPTIKPAIQAAYDLQSAAYNRLDADGVLAVCSPDYEDVDRGKTKPLPDYEKTIRTFVAMAASMTARATVREVLDSHQDSRGNTAEVLVERHFEITLQPSLKDGKNHRFVSSETNRDTWIHPEGKGWQKRRSVNLDFRATMDGQPVTD